MARTRPAIQSLNGGEVDLEVVARSDLENYTNKAELYLNALPAVKGGMFKAPGLRLIGRLPAGDGEDKEGIVREWRYSTYQAFMLEIVEGQIRIVYDTGYIQTGPGTSILGAWNDGSDGDGGSSGDPPDWPDDPWTPGYDPPAIPPPVQGGGAAGGSTNHTGGNTGVLP